MSAAIEPGMWVEYVGPEPEPDFPLGAIRQVVGLDPDVWECVACFSSDPGIEVAGVDHSSACYCACELRPIYRPKADFIESLKAPAPEQELA